MDWCFLIDSLVYAIILVSLYYICNKTFAKSNISVILLIVFVFKIVSSYFEFDMLSSLADVALISAFMSVVIFNEQKINKLLKRKNSAKNKQNAGFDKRQFYKTINTTVNMLSSSKIGAIMTFERKNSLEEYIKRGVKVDAPVSSELLTTIFYPGTTLHDGAVIIRGTNIEAASVYYTPTVKALGGKYGARHRASLGISEVCDAVTVVVSEETGRISLAIDGELIAVNRDTFLPLFKEELEK